MRGIPVKYKQLSAVGILFLLLASGCTSNTAPAASILPSTSATPNEVTAPTRSDQPSTLPPLTTTVTSTITVPPSGADPQTVAMAWLIAYRSASWEDDALAWINRASALATPPLAASYEALRAGKGGGIAWNEFAANHCVATVTDTGAVIPAEAPRTDSTVAVQVGATLVTACGSGKAVPKEELAVTLTLTKVDNQWKVASHDF